MCRLFFIAFIVIALVSCTSRMNEFDALKFKGIYQMDSLYGLKFDLSGIVQIRDSVYIIADKPWNSFLYNITFEEKTFKVFYQRNLKFDEKIDLEGVDQCGENIYFVNERKGMVYLCGNSQQIKPLPIDLSSENMNPKNWGNAGWEGIAIDCESHHMYLIKEREPRRIFQIDLASNELIRSFNIPESESNDFSDAKFENGHLYVIERNGNYIAKIDPKSESVVDKYHYRDVASHPEGKLYGPTQYGMGEALLLTPDEIWVGLDNNGLEVTAHARRTHGISGKSPVILKFERPEGF